MTFLDVTTWLIPASPFVLLRLAISELHDLVHIGKFPRVDGGNISLYAVGGGILIGTFFSGDNDRGGVLAVDVRLPREAPDIHALAFSRMSLF